MEQFGPYRLEELLGRGGMGEVYRAFDTGRRRTVALKRLHRSFAADPDFQARFRRESELVARLVEPHIIPIHDYGEIDGQLYLDMRLVRGVDLGTILARQGPLTVSRAVHVVSQVADALDAAHAEGLVHRDVKPSNVLLLASGDRGVPDGDRDFAYLVDFGIARSVAGSGSTALTLTGATIGTLHYMAPEQFGDGSFDHRVDVYALACVLYEVLTGRKPYDGNGLAVMYAHADKPVPRPSERRPDLPAALDEVIMRGMAKQRHDRYPAAGELAAAARAALAAADSAPTVLAPGAPGRPAAASSTATLPRPMPAAPAPAPPSGTPRAGRRRRWLVITMVALLGFAGLGAGAWYLMMRAPERVLASTIVESCRLESGQDAAGTAATYPPDLVQDGNPATAWRCNGDGAGQRLVLDFDRPVAVSAIAIVPGYAKNDPTNGHDRYRQGRRLAEVSY